MKELARKIEAAFLPIKEEALASDALVEQFSITYKGNNTIVLDYVYIKDDDADPRSIITQIKKGMDDEHKQNLLLYTMQAIFNAKKATDKEWEDFTSLYTRNDLKLI